MYRFISVFFMCVMIVLYGSTTSKNNLITFAKSVASSVVVLSDDNDSRLVSILDEDLELFVDKLNLQNYSEFYIEDRLIIEGYSSMIDDHIVINNNKINIQISVSDGACLIGSPMIKNSF